GRVTFQKMKESGFEKCSDLYALSKMELAKRYGKWGVKLYSLTRGIDEREVKVARERKSLSVECTFSEDVKEINEFQDHFHSLYEELVERYEHYRQKNPDRVIAGFVVKIKFFDFKL